MNRIKQDSIGGNAAGERTLCENEKIRWNQKIREKGMGPKNGLTKQAVANPDEAEDEYGMEDMFREDMYREMEDLYREEEEIYSAAKVA